MSARRPWRIWTSHGVGWHALGIAYGSEEAAVRAAWREFPKTFSMLGHGVGVGRVHGGRIKPLSEYPRPSDA